MEIHFAYVFMKIQKMLQFINSIKIFLVHQLKNVKPTHVVIPEKIKPLSTQ